MWMKRNQSDRIHFMNTVNILISFHFVSQFKSVNWTQFNWQVNVDREYRMFEDT
jgi:hypothetical protein